MRREKQMTAPPSSDSGARQPVEPLSGNVLVTWIDYDPDDPHTGGRLRDAGLQVSLAPKHGARSPEELVPLVRDAVAAIVSTDPFERSVFAAAPHLRVVARVGVGTDSVDIAAATDAGVVVTTTPGANRETAADHALAMILAALRRIVEHDASVRRGEWRRAGAMTPWDLHGTTVGLVGFGAIGRAVSRRLAGFATHVLVTDPAYAHAHSGSGYEVVGFADLIARADVVSLHLPLLESTRHIISHTELAAMRPEALLVNTSRGGLVDENALIDALVTGRLRGAALDVYTDEPAVPAGLLSLPNVVLTPHIGGLSHASIRQMTRDATGSVLGVLTGSPVPGSVVNPTALRNPRQSPAAQALATPGTR
jgi:phosphoglycerate dehydrogenase-like enzyme